MARGRNETPDSEERDGSEAAIAPAPVVRTAVAEAVAPPAPEAARQPDGTPAAPPPSAHPPPPA